MQNTDLSIIIPCYNEEKNIPLILRRFKSLLKRMKNVELILVNNGSTDNSAKVLRKVIPNYKFARTVLIRVNKGYGFGILSGLLTARGKYLCWTHADMQTDPGDPIKAYYIIKNERSPEKVFVKGKRIGRPISDLVLTYAMSIFESILFGRILYDINAQPNLFHKSFMKIAKNPPKDFSLDLYFYYIAMKHNYKMRRFDVYFKKRIHGKSHWNTSIINKIKTIKRAISYSLNLRFG